MAIAFEVFANNPSTTVATNGYQGGASTGDAPAGGTSETWTMAAAGPFAVAASAGTPPTQFHAADPAAPTEIILVTDNTGSSGTTWVVTRGAEATTPVTHAANATFYQVTTAGFLASLMPVIAVSSDNPWTSTGTSPLLIDGMSVTVPANITYRLRGRINFTASITTGAPKFAFTGPATTICNYSAWFQNSSTTLIAPVQQTTFTTTMTGPTFTSSNNHWLDIDGIVEFSSGGTVTMTGFEGTSGDAFSVPLGGGYFELIPVGLTG